MNTTTVRDLRANMKAHFDAIEDSQDILVVPRSGDKEPIVLMTLSEYNSFAETEYLLSTDANREMLEKSIAQLENGETVPFELPNE